MAIHLLSARQIEAAPAGQLNDGEGLTLRIEDGQGRWWFRYTGPGGKRRAMSLGAAVIRGDRKLIEASLVHAREIAAEARGLLVRGVDPLDIRNSGKQKARRQAEAKQAEQRQAKATLIRVARDYHARVIEPNRTSKHSAQWIASIEGPTVDEPRPERAKLAALLDRPITSITGPELLDAITDLQAVVPETASRVRQRLEAIFDEAEFRGLCSGNPARAIRRKLRESKARRERGSFAALPFAEVPAFVHALREQKGTAARALEFAVLTAARTGEVLGATWAEIDAQAGIWRVPAARMKGGEEHVVYLSARALEIVESMREVGGDYVFPSPADKRQPLSNMAMLTLLRRMDADKRTTVHGLCRASFSTWANETAAARPDVVEACLAHREGDRIRSAYNRAQFAAERRGLLRAWAQYCEVQESMARGSPALTLAA